MSQKIVDTDNIDCEREILYAKYIEAVESNQEKEDEDEDEEDVLRELQTEILQKWPELIQRKIKKAIQYVKQTADKSLQFKGLRILLNISQGSDNGIEMIVNAGAVPPVVRLTKSSDENVIKHSVNTLSHLVTLNTEVRDYVIGQGVIDRLIGFIKPGACSTFMIHVTRMLRDISGHQKPPLSPHVAQKILAAAKDSLSLLEEPAYEYIFTAIHYLELYGHLALVVANDELMLLMIDMLSKSISCVKPLILLCLSTLSNGEKVHVDTLLEYGMLKPLQRLLYSTEEIRKCTLTIISNVLKHSAEHVQRILDTNLLCGILVNLKCRLPEAIECINNWVLVGNQTQVRILYSAGVVEPLTVSLWVDDVTTIANVLCGLYNLLNMVGSAQESKVAEAIRKCGALDKVKMLRNHPDITIRHTAHCILSRFYSFEYEPQPNPVTGKPFIWFN